MELLEYIAILKKYWYLILGLTVIAALVAGISSSLMAPIYESDAKILVRDKNSSSIDTMIFGAMGGQARNQIQNSVEILKSRSLAFAASKNLGLDYPLGSAKLNVFRAGYSIQPVQGTDFIRISYQSKEPAFARDAVNALVDAFVETTLLYNREEARSARNFIEDQLVNMTETLRISEERLRQFKEKERILSPSEEAKAIVNRLTSLEVSRSEALVAKREEETKLEQMLTQLQKETNTYISSQVISTNPLVTNIKTQLIAKETELEVLLSKSTPNSREVINLKKEIDVLKLQLNQQVEQIVTSQTETTNPLYQQLIVSISQTQTIITALESRISALADLAKETEKQFDLLPEKEIELARLTRDLQVAENIYSVLLQKKEEYRIQEAMQTANIQKVDMAILPDINKPVSPKTKMNIAVAIFLGLFLGAMLAFLFEYLDNTIVTKEDIEQYLELSVLAMIPEINTEGGAYSAGEKKFKRR